MELSSSVHPQETTARFAGGLSYRQRMILPVEAEYRATQDLYDAIDYRDSQERIYGLWQCKRDAWLAVSKRSRRVIVLSNSCRLRWCPLCSHNKASRISEAIGVWLKSHPRPKMLTLTLKHSDESLDSQISRLYSCFREFRRAKYYRDNIHGGVWFFQVKWIESSQQWHPHLHCLLDSEYLPHDYIKSTWKHITGDSDVVDIRVIRKAKHAADYVARYAARPAKLADMSPENAVTVFDALHGRRLCGKWGTASEISFGLDPQFERDEYTPLARYDRMSLHTRASAFAQLLWDCYVNQKPVPMAWNLTELDEGIEPIPEPIICRVNPPPDPLLPF